MENKEVEDCIFDLACGLHSKQSYNTSVVYHIEGLEKENKELKEQLEAKDKALDKACEELEMFDIQFSNVDYADQKNIQEWKEWCESDIHGKTIRV